MEQEKNLANKAEDTSVQASTDMDEGQYLVKFKTPYRFEGQDYEGLDLGGLEALTIQDAVDAQKQLFGEREIAAAMLCETTTAFAAQLAARATGKPIEFFKLMPRGAMRRVAAAVRAHLNVESNTENHVMRFTRPHTHEGREIAEVDLGGIDELNTMQESAAENRLARAGFVVTENSGNYLYACVIASMATGLAEEFFTTLPLCELLRLKNAVNDADFFE